MPGVSGGGQESDVTVGGDRREPCGDGTVFILTVATVTQSYACDTAVSDSIHTYGCPSVSAGDWFQDPRRYPKTSLLRALLENVLQITSRLLLNTCDDVRAVKTVATPYRSGDNVMRDGGATVHDLRPTDTSATT